VNVDLWNGCFVVGMVIVTSVSHVLQIPAEPDAVQAAVTS